MTTVEQVATPVLASIPNVELMHAGTWNISTGTATFTGEDLHAAVAALDCPAVRRPVLKLGHTDPRFDGEPAVGWVGNLHTDGSTLWGDYLGMPRWLATASASAYPDRSIEGMYDFTCQVGHTHPFVLTGVALLGVTAPGIGTLASLQDVAQLYGVAAAAEESTTSRPVTIHASGGNMANKVFAGASTEDVRRAFYEDAPWSYWIQEIQLEPLQLIVMNDDDGELQRVPVTVDPNADGEDAVSFGAGVPVVVRYEDVPNEDAAEGEPTLAAKAAPNTSRVVYASREESRRVAAGDQLPAAEPEDPNQEGESDMTDALTGGLKTRLGLAPDAELGEDELLAALDEALAERAEPVAASTKNDDKSEVPEGQMMVSKNVWEEMQISAKAGAEARARQLREDRDNAISAAVRAGKIAPARREHWASAWDKDPEGTAKDLSELPENRLPVSASGYSGGGEDANGESVTYDSLFPDEKKKEN